MTYPEWKKQAERELGVKAVEPKVGEKYRLVRAMSSAYAYLLGTDATVTQVHSDNGLFLVFETEAEAAQRWWPLEDFWREFKPVEAPAPLPSSPQEEVPVGSRWRMADGSCVIRVVRLEGHRVVYEYEKARSTRVMGREFDWTPELLKASCTRLPDTEAKPAAKEFPAFRHTCGECGGKFDHVPFVRGGKDICERCHDQSGCCKPEPSPADPWSVHLEEERRIYAKMQFRDASDWKWPEPKPVTGPPQPMLTGSAGLACPLYRSKR